VNTDRLNFVMTIARQDTIKVFALAGSNARNNISDRRYLFENEGHKTPCLHENMTYRNAIWSVALRPGQKLRWVSSSIGSITSRYLFSSSIDLLQTRLSFRQLRDWEKHCTTLQERSGITA